MRLIHAVRDISVEIGTRIETVALYTDADVLCTTAGTPIEIADRLSRSGNILDRPTLFPPGERSAYAGAANRSAKRQARRRGGVRAIYWELAVVCLLVIDVTVQSGDDRIYRAANIREPDRVDSLPVGYVLTPVA
jgi:CBS domain-containing protein